MKGLKHHIKYNVLAEEVLEYFLRTTMLQVEEHLILKDTEFKPEEEPFIYEKDTFNSRDLRVGLANSVDPDKMVTSPSHQKLHCLPQVSILSLHYLPFCFRYLSMYHPFLKNYTTFMARASLGTWKFIRDMGSSSHWGFIMAPGQEANGDNLASEVFLVFYTIMVCWMYSLGLPW